ncbi:MAG: MoaD/ThiS family protein [Faecousia sp.]
MITVKLYGLLRLDSGIRERQMEAGSVKEVYAQLMGLGLTRKDLDGCMILVNGKPANKRQKINDGDVVQLLPPVAGG